MQGNACEKMTKTVFNPKHTKDYKNLITDGIGNGWVRVIITDFTYGTEQVYLCGTEEVAHHHCCLFPAWCEAVPKQIRTEFSAPQGGHADGCQECPHTHPVSFYPGRDLRQYMLLTKAHSSYVLLLHCFRDSDGFGILEVVPPFLVDAGLSKARRKGEKSAHSSSLIGDEEHRCLVIEFNACVQSLAVLHNNQQRLCMSLSRSLRHETRRARFRAYLRQAFQTSLRTSHMLWIYHANHEQHVKTIATHHCCGSGELPLFVVLQAGDMWVVFSAPVPLR